MIILLVAAPQTFIGICKQTFHTYLSIRKCHKYSEINLVRFTLPKFYPMKAMSQSPSFDIEYSGSYRPFLPRKLKWSKIQNIYCNFFNFQYNNIQLRWLSTASSNGHSHYPYTCIYQPIIEDFVTIVLHVLQPNLKTLKKTYFFPVMCTN